MIVSLFQDFVLDAVLANFADQNQIDIDPIIETDWQQRSKLVPFLATIYIDKENINKSEEQEKSEIRNAFEVK
jgi:hypothetical protein